MRRDPPKLVEFRTQTEPWCVYELEDGSLVRIRSLVIKIINEGKFDAEGYPMYQLKHVQIVDMTWSDAVEAEAATRRAEPTRGNN